MPVLPFHKYLGPGNDINSGEPVDEDDRIAQQHDSAYESALTAADITHADEDAIRAFSNDFSTTGNIHSLIGAAGLTLKNQIERHTGVLYPTMPQGHQNRYKALSFRNRAGVQAEERRNTRQGEQDVRRDNMQDATQPTRSRDVSDVGQIEDTNSPMSTDQVDAPQAENGMPASGGVTNPHNNISTLYLNKSLAGSGMTFFRKSRLMHTWGFASSKFARGPAGAVDDYQAYNTSLAYVPVDWLPFYLSQAEYNLLPEGSYIKEVHVEIIPKGVRCSFDTGTTLTGTANSMHVIYGKHCIGLNHKLEMVNLKLKQKDANPMSIESLGEMVVDDFEKRFHGDTDKYHSKDEAYFPCSWGANRALPLYACIMATTNESSKNKMHKKTGWPRVDNIIDKYNLNEHINTPCIQYSYKPRNGIIKNLKNSSVVPNNLSVFSGKTDIGQTLTKFVGGKLFQNSVSSVSPFSSIDAQYHSIIEKSHLHSTFNDLTSLRSQPQIHIGIEPVQSNAPADIEPTFVNASAEYEINCSCVIGFNSDLMYAYGNYASKMNLSAGAVDSKQHQYLTQNHVGGMLAHDWKGNYDVEKT